MNKICEGSVWCITRRSQFGHATNSKTRTVAELRSALNAAPVGTPTDIVLSPVVFQLGGTPLDVWGGRDRLADTRRHLPEVPRLPTRAHPAFARAQKAHWIFFLPRSATSQRSGE